MDLNKGQQSLLMAITMNNGCSVPKKSNSDANHLYASGYIDIAKKSNGEFYEVTDKGRDKVKELISIHRLKYDIPLRQQQRFSQELDDTDSDKVHKLIKPIYDSYLKMIKYKNLDEAKLLALEFIDELHVVLGQARLLNAMHKRKEKQKNKI